jgi:hypothetical protein
VYFRRSGAGCPREKQYIAPSVEKKGVLEDLRDKLSPSSVGKRLHSFSKLVQIDFQVLKEWLRRTAKFSRIEIEGDMGIGSEKG